MLNQLFSVLLVCIVGMQCVERDMWLCGCVAVEVNLIPNHLEEMQHDPSLMTLPFTSLL